MPSNLNQKIDIGKIYEENFDKLYKFFYYKVLSKDIAEDLASETFLTYANIIKGQNEIEDPIKFLYGAAKNIFLRYLRDKYQQGIPFTDIDENFEDYCTQYVQENQKDLNDETLEEKLQKYLEFIPAKQKITLRLRFLEKLTLSEICDRVGKDMNYVKTMQKRGLKSLRDAIELIP